MVYPQVVDGGGNLQIWRVAVNIQQTRGCPAAWGVDEGLTTHHCKNLTCYKMEYSPRPVQILFNIISNGKCTWFGTWELSSLCWLGSFQTVPRELAKYRLYFGGYRWDKEGTVDYTFFCGNKSENHQLGTGFCRYHQRIIMAIKTAEFVSTRLPIWCWENTCDITVLNVHAPTADKRDDSRYSLY